MIEQPFRHALHDHLIARLRDISTDRAGRLAAIRTREQAARYCVDVRRRIARCFGPMPKRTPLRAEVTGTVGGPGYTIEKLTYESRPGFIVTANLYRPEGSGPFPAVLAPCGHSAVGKAEPRYQQFCAALAKAGFIALIYDPVSQGERLQYLGEPGMPQDPPNCCVEHNMAGNQMSLVGDFLGTWRAWDGIRGIDYLLTRDDVDRHRLGVTGNSGGGTLSTYLAALDSRLSMAAPSCFITTYLSNLENELPADAEQMPPGVLAAGLDMADFVLAHAPRPTLLLGQHNCFFDERGLRKSFEQIRRIYRLLGKAKDVDLFVGAHTHGYHTDAQLAMCRFFAKQCGLKLPTRIADAPDLPPDALFATPTGQVQDVRGQRFIHAFTRDTATAMRAARKPLKGDALRTAMRKVLGVDTRRAAAHYRVLRPIGDVPSKVYDLDFPLGLETEPGRVLAVLHMLRHGRAAGAMPYLAQPPVVKQAVMYLPDVSTLDDLRAGLVPLDARQCPDVLFAVDARGLGMMRSGTCQDEQFHAPYGSDYMEAAHGQMLGESHIGRRVHDVLCSLDLLKATGTKRVHLVGRGLGAVLATFAACLHPVVGHVTLRDGLRSFDELTQTPVNGWPLSILPRDILRHFDLEDCYQLIGKRRLTATKWRHADGCSR
jgi:dienelactone hydrolase